MICSICKHENYKKHGKDPCGQQRFRCLLCGKTWIESQPKPFGRMNIPKDKAILCLRMLLEGNSIRTTERLVGISKNTILDLLALIGSRAEDYWTNHMIGLPAENVELDEVWGFVGCKEKTRVKLSRKNDCCGDAYCFLAIERDTKLLISWHLGKRDPADTAWFASKLRHATVSRFQISADGFKPYCKTIPEAFSFNVDFAQIIKLFGKGMGGGNGRYSPPDIIGICKRRKFGNPDMNQVCTSHVERQNLNIRMGIRRMTRLTNAFSKKWENHEHHLALYFLWYNYCRVHQTLKTTPAVAAGLTDQVWTLERLLMELATKC